MPVWARGARATHLTCVGNKTGTFASSWTHAAWKVEHRQKGHQKALPISPKANPNGPNQPHTATHRSSPSCPFPPKPSPPCLTSAHRPSRPTIHIRPNPLSVCCEVAAIILARAGYWRTHLLTVAHSHGFVGIHTWFYHKSQLGTGLRKGSAIQTRRDNMRACVRRAHDAAETGTCHAWIGLG